MAVVQPILSYGPVLYISWGTLTTSGLVSGFPGGWQVTNSGRTIEYIIQDSSNCGGPNPNVQTGLAISTFVTGPTAYSFNPVLSGLGERQAPGIYEVMRLYLNNQEIIRASSPGGGLGCAPGGPVVIDILVPGPYTLPAGTTNTFRLDFSTGDAAFHVDCFYRCELNLTPIT